MTSYDALGVQKALDKRAQKQHTHKIDEVTGLPLALAEKASGADVAMLSAALSGKAAVNHTHTIAGVEGLQTALEGKAAANHTHTGLVNVSPAKMPYTFRQSTVDVAGTYEGMNDDSTTTRALTSSQTSGGAWLRADFDSARFVSWVRIAAGMINMTSTAAALNASVLEVSMDATNWINVCSLSGFTDPSILSFAVGVPAKFVRIRRPSMGSLGCFEFQVFG
jgi:Phage tail repeat like